MLIFKTGYEINLSNQFNNFTPPSFSLKPKPKKKCLFISWLEYVICLLVTCPLFSMQVKKTMLILKLLWNKHMYIYQMNNRGDTIEKNRSFRHPYSYFSCLVTL